MIAMERQHHPFLAAVFMFMATLFFCLADVMGKWLTDGLLGGTSGLAEKLHRYHRHVLPSLSLRPTWIN